MSNSPRPNNGIGYELTGNNPYKNNKFKGNLVDAIVEFIKPFLPKKNNRFGSASPF